MAFDRDSTLKKGEKFLRQGTSRRRHRRIRRASSRTQPRDWNTANLLGDLYFRAGQKDEALAPVPAHRRAPAARGLLSESRRALQEDPQDQARRREHAARARRKSPRSRGCSRTPRVTCTPSAARRRERGDRGRRRGHRRPARRRSIPPTSSARLEAARTLEEMGRPAEPPIRFRERPRRPAGEGSRRRGARGAARRRAAQPRRQGRTRDPGARDGRRRRRARRAATTSIARRPATIRCCLRRSGAGSALPAASSRARELMAELLASEHDVSQRLARNWLDGVRRRDPGSGVSRASTR